MPARPPRLRKPRLQCFAFFLALVLQMTSPPSTPAATISQGVRPLSSQQVMGTTVWYGFTTGGAAATVGVGGIWDFDTSPTGTALPPTSPDALQGWTKVAIPYRSGASRAPVNRPEWYLNYGNVGQFWGQKNMTTVADHNGSFTNTNIGGTGVAWCGLDQPAFSNMLQDFDATSGCSVSGPGYGDQWDQYIVKDIAVSAGGTTVTFKYRIETDLQAEDASAVTQNGAMYDQLDVYVGVPTPGTFGFALPATDDISDLVNSATLLVGNLKGNVTTTTVTTPTFGGGLLGIGSAARLIFRFRSNRVNSDQSGAVQNGSGFTNGTDAGGAQIDDIYFSNAAGRTGGAFDPPSADGHNFASRYTFDSSLQGWQPCAKPLPTWAHLINVGNNDPLVGGLLYDELNPDGNWADPTGPPGSLGALSGMKNNVLSLFDPIGPSPGNPRDHYSLGNWPIAGGDNDQGAMSPNIHLTTGVGNPIPVVQFDDYSYLPIGEYISYQIWIRYKAPSNTGAGGFPCPEYGPWTVYPTNFQVSNPAGQSVTTFLPLNSSDWTDVQIMLSAITECWASSGGSGTCAGNFTPLFDNVRFGLCPSSSSCAPGTGGGATVQNVGGSARGESQSALSDLPWLGVPDNQLWQDAFPVDSIPSGVYYPMQKQTSLGVRTNAVGYTKTRSAADHAIDAQTAVATGCANITDLPHTSTGQGVYQPDSVVVYCPFSTRGTRVDCVFRVLPGPLTNTNSAWFAAYKANTGIYGSLDGGQHQHGAGGPNDPWKSWLWNSVQLDTAEIDAYDLTADVVTARLAKNEFASTIAEGDPHYSMLGINHCLPLADPTSIPPGAWLQACSSIYTKEHTPIFPSYVFTPGTVVEYFYRASFNDNPGNATLFPDTTQSDAQGQKYLRWRVLPDAWKDYAQYGPNPFTGQPGPGRACVLFVNRSDQESQAYTSYHGAFDSLGIIADEYTSHGASEIAPGLGNAAVAMANPAFSFYGSGGPSLAQLLGYEDVFYSAGGLSSQALGDGIADEDASADVELFSAWLSDTGHKRLLWLNGSSIAKGLCVWRGPGTSRTFASTTLGLSPTAIDNAYANGSYRSLASVAVDCIPVNNSGTSPWTSGYGSGKAISGNTLAYFDMLAKNASGSSSYGELYANPGGAGISGVSVVNLLANGSIALTDAAEFSELRGPSCHDDYGRIEKMRTIFYKLAVNGATPFCTDFSGQTSTPPGSGPLFLTSLEGISPNPSRSGGRAEIRFALSADSRVKLSLFDISGRVTRTLLDGPQITGIHRVPLDGLDARGRRIPAGVYFVRMTAGQFESTKKLLILH